MSDLLPAEALKGVRVGFSISESPDLARLGLPEEHVRLTVTGLARLVLEAGGSLASGGRLDPDGYPALLLQELRRAGRTDRPMLVCLAWGEHRRLSLAELARRRREAGPYAEIVCLDPEGREVDPAAGRGAAPEPETDPGRVRRALTAMRRYLTGRIDGRVLIGGRREGFLGEVPGLLEEALLTLERGLPLYPAGGFGGVTADIVRALGVADAPRPPAAPEPDPRLGEGLARLRALAARTGRSGPAGLGNGLTAAENRTLAVSSRPGEIAALVGLGLRRLRGGPRE